MAAPYGMSVDKEILDPSCSRSIWNVIEVAGGIWRMVIDGGRNYSVTERKSGSDSLECPARGYWLTDHRFD